ncbi:hypothetical protein GCM10022288_15690 [Gryllotalpicola kribbensis]|uniref:Competence protein CoiA nuclease-like domain-containing protein n=1 Tax=Gryllotalpicola kribbensis TaxID=993084 RepID=A0ABP8ARJ7_9MICO
MTVLEGSHADQLAAFQREERNFVYGRLDTGDPWFLSDDEAIERRLFVRENVLCPVPDCDTPQLTTVHRPVHRDHLRHLSKSAIDHAAESVFHANACALIKEWLDRRYPKSHAQREQWSDNGKRRADVMLTSEDGTARIAFEIQYSSLSVLEWRQRHDSYREQGIVDVWLFGHNGHHFRPTGDDAVKLSDVHRAILKSGSPVMWLNPVIQLVGVAWRDMPLHKLVGTMVTAAEMLPVLDPGSKPAWVNLLDLDAFNVARDGLHSAWLDELVENTRRRKEHNEAVQLDLQEARARAAEQEYRDLLPIHQVPQKPMPPQPIVETKPPPLPSPQLRSPAVDERAARRAREDQIVSTAEAARRRIAEHYGPWHGSDAHLAAVSFFTSGAPELDEHWQAEAYFELVAGQQASFTVGDVARVAARRSELPLASSTSAAAAWVDRLVRHGFLTYVWRPDGQVQPTGTGRAGGHEFNRVVRRP